MAAQMLLKNIWDKVSGEYADLIQILEGGKEEAVMLCKDRNISLSLSNNQMMLVVFVVLQDWEEVFWS